MPGIFGSLNNIVTPYERATIWWFRRLTRDYSTFHLETLSEDARDLLTHLIGAAFVEIQGEFQFSGPLADVDAPASQALVGTGRDAQTVFRVARFHEHVNLPAGVLLIRLTDDGEFARLALLADPETVFSDIRNAVEDPKDGYLNYAPREITDGDSPADDEDSIASALDFVAQVTMEKNTVQIGQIATDTTKSADVRMREICHIDTRYYAHDSVQWGELLRCSPANIRKTPFWKVDRANYLRPDD